MEVVPEEADAILNAIAATYKTPPDPVPRIALVDMQVKLLRAVWGEETDVSLKSRDPVALSLWCMESLGHVIEGGELTSSAVVVKKWGYMMDEVVDCWLMLHTVYELDAPYMVPSAMGYARLAAKICYGDGSS